MVEFFLYKSLKKPLTFFGLKDKYIYYAAISAIGGIVIGIILSTIFNTIGTVTGLIISGVGIWYTFKLQEKNGMYNKTKNVGEIHIFPNRFKYKQIKSNRKC